MNAVFPSNTRCPIARSRNTVAEIRIRVLELPSEDVQAFVPRLLDRGPHYARPGWLP